VTNKSCHEEYVFVRVVFAYCHHKDKACLRVAVETALR